MRRKQLLKDIREELKLQTRENLQYAKEVSQEVLIQISLIEDRFRDKDDIFYKRKRMRSSYATLQRASKTIYETSLWDRRQIFRLLTAHELLLGSLEGDIADAIEWARSLQKPKIRAKKLAQIKRHHLVHSNVSKILESLQRASNGMIFLQSVKNISKSI